MPITARILTDADQGNNRRLLSVHYSSAGFAETKSHRVPSTVDAQVYVDNIAIRLQESREVVSLDYAVNQVSRGQSPSSEYHTQAEILTEAIKRLFNLMLDTTVDPKKYETIKNLIPVIEKYSDSQVAGLIGWTVENIADARKRLLAVVSAAALLDHGHGEIK